MFLVYNKMIMNCFQKKRFGLFIFSETGSSAFAQQQAALEYTVNIFVTHFEILLLSRVTHIPL